MEEEPGAGAPEPLPLQFDILKNRIQSLCDNNAPDFDSWVSLIKEAEETSVNDIEVISLVYDSFLLEFPLCYGYWIKYAAHKARLCTIGEVVEVYEQAVQAVPHSVDLWVSYCGFAVCAYEEPAHIRRLFEKALSLVGKDYLCYHLWDKYIEFENSQKQLIQLATIYIYTLKFPTKKLRWYYESFRKLATLMEHEVTHSDAERLSVNLRTLEVINAEESEGDASTKIAALHDENGGQFTADAIKHYLVSGEHLYERSSKIDKEISCFEASIKRPFFHVKPLDDDQLENWHQYLDFVEKNGDFDWAVKLYERCLIPCANYSEFWIRYAEFVDAKGGREIASYALGRASSCFVKGVPMFHMYYAIFKEQIGDTPGARSLFIKGSNNLTSNFYVNINRQANMEKRMGNTKAASEIYETAIQDAMQKKNVEILPGLYTNFAQFKYAVNHSIREAKEIFVKGIKQAPCKALIKGFIQFMCTHGGPTHIHILDSVISDAVIPGSNVSTVLSPEDREDISLLFLEFVDLYGDVKDLRKAWARHSKLFPHNTRNLLQRYCNSENGLQENNKRRRTEFYIAAQDDSPKDTTTLKQLSKSDTCSLLVDKEVEPQVDKGTLDSGKGHTDAEEQNILGNVDMHQEVDNKVQECIDMSHSQHSLDKSGMQNQMNAHDTHEISHNLSLCEQDQTTESTHPAVSKAPHAESFSCDSPSKPNAGSKINALDNIKNVEVSASVHQGAVCPISDSPSVASLPKEGSPPDPVQVSPELEEKQHDKVQVKLETEDDVSVSNTNLAKSSDSTDATQHDREILALCQEDIQSSQPQQLSVCAKPSNSEMTTSRNTTSSQFSPNTAVTCQTQLQHQIANSHMCQSHNLSLAEQNMQQGLAYEISQNAQTSSQSQAQAQIFTQPNQGNQQYLQMMHGYASQMWQYYQQQMYYLQTQHNQQLQSLQQQQLPTDHLQQNFMQQVQQLNQQMVLWQQQLQHALPVQQQHDQKHGQYQSSSGDTKHEQNKLQKHESQMDHQSQHVQQQQFYFQQQQQMYLMQQQQQMYQQQLLQQQLKQQQQYFTQMPQLQQNMGQQQQQQMVALQQQQQQFIQQQMHQYQQQQTNQQGAKYESCELNPQDANPKMEHGQQSEASQSDGSKLRSGEQSELSYPSTPQSQHSNH
ncbi:hypothetical protein ABZP36_024425 [Zizania latifolia]